MFSKKQGILLAVLSILLVVWVVVRYWDGQNNPSFTADFPVVHPEEIHTIELYSTFESQFKVTLYNTENGWRVRRYNTDVPASQARVITAIEELGYLSATRLAGTGEDEWERFGVADSQVTRLVAYTDRGVELDLLIGKFQYLQTDNTPLITRAPPSTHDKRGITYVRLTGDDKVYTAEGFFGPHLYLPFRVWREYQVLKIDSTQLDSIQFIYPEGGSYTVVTNDAGWEIGNTDVHPKGREIYLSAIAYREYGQVADAFVLDRSATFEVNYYLSSGEAVNLKAYEANSGQIIIASSQNDGTFFLDQDDELLDELFPPKYFFTAGK